MSNNLSRLQLRRDASSNWNSINPILNDGEMGLDTTTMKIKVGNGIDRWNDLTYTEIVDAPNDDKIYGRKNNEWVQLVVDDTTGGISVPISGEDPEDKVYDTDPISVFKIDNALQNGIFLNTSTSNIPDVRCLNLNTASTYYFSSIRYLPSLKKYCICFFYNNNPQYDSFYAIYNEDLTQCTNGIAPRDPLSRALGSINPINGIYNRTKNYDKSFNDIYEVPGKKMYIASNWLGALYYSYDLVNWTVTPLWGDNDFYTGLYKKYGTSYRDYYPFYTIAHSTFPNLRYNIAYSTILGPKFIYRAIDNSIYHINNMFYAKTIDGINWRKVESYKITVDDHSIIPGTNLNGYGSFISDGTYSPFLDKFIMLIEGNTAQIPDLNSSSGKVCGLIASTNLDNDEWSYHMCDYKVNHISSYNPPNMQNKGINNKHICWSPKLKKFCQVRTVLGNIGSNYAQTHSIQILLSNDGIDWNITYQQPPTNYHEMVDQLIWAPRLNRFLCLYATCQYDSSTPSPQKADIMLMSSADGINWDKHSLPAAMSKINLYRVYESNGYPFLGRSRLYIKYINQTGKLFIGTNDFKFNNLAASGITYDSRLWYTTIV